MSTKVYTLNQVAELLQVTPLTVRRRLLSGELEGFKIGTAWRITQEQLDKFIDSTSTHGKAQDDDGTGSNEGA